MTFDEAKVVVVPFGKYKGKTVDQIAVTDDGLKYLDWLVAYVADAKVKEALEVYLSDALIQDDLEGLIGKESREEGT